MRRWFFRILKVAAIAIVALIVIVQVVLWTPLPRRIVLRQIETELGLRISASNLSTGWLGNSELTGVSLGLPLSNTDFLKVKSLKIKHSSLIGLALGNVQVQSIEIDDPLVELAQNPQGKWNLQQLIELLDQASQSGGEICTASKTVVTGIPKLPKVKLVNGVVHITSNLGHSLSLAPLNATGESNGALLWNCDLTIANSLALKGRLAPGGSWQHQIVLSLQNLDPLLKDWGVPTTYGATIQSQWDGQIANGKWIGTLLLNQVTAGNVPALGDVSVAGSVGAEVDGADGGVITLHPNQVDVKTTNATLPDLAIEAGSIISDSSGLRAQAVKLTALGGRANFDGTFEPQTMAADLHARWSGLSLTKNLHQNGSLSATLREPFVGQPVIVVDLSDNGAMGQSGNRWSTQLNLTGQGKSWQVIDWVLSAPQLTCGTASQSVDLSQLSAHISQHWPIVELTSLSLPANASASGQINFQSRQWHFDASGAFNTTFQNTPVPMTLALSSSGNDSRYDLKSLSLGVADLTFTVDGWYDSAQPNPVDLNVRLAQTPRIAPDAPVQGEVNGDFKIIGALFKEHGRFRPYLTTTGDLRSSDLVVFNRPVGDIDIKLEGDTSTPDLPDGDTGPSITEIRTIDFNLFQAPWDFSINYPNAGGNLEATLETRKLELEEVARFAKMKGITGQLVSAKWNAVVPSLNWSAIDLRSEYHLSNLDASGYTADSVDARASLNNGILKLNSLVAKNGTGSITTSASLDLQNTRHLITQITVDRWPYAVSQTVTALLSARSKMNFDLTAKDLGATGTLIASTDLVLGASTKLAHADLNAGIVDRAISIDQLSGNVLTGIFNGHAKLDLDKPLQATGQVVWDKVDAAAFAAVFPQLDGLGGMYSGTITLAPARDPRPLEPVRVDINVASTNGHFRSMLIGGKGLLTVHGVAYLNTDHAVLPDSDIYLAGGIMHVWGRVGYRPGTRLATHVQVDVEKFQLDQVAHIDPKLTKPVPGVFNAQIVVVRSGPHSSQVLAQAHADLSQADLGNFGPVAALYSLMHVGAAPSSGFGSVDLAFEQDVLHVTNFGYFNHGVEARGLCSVGPLNYSNPMLTKVDGQMVGTARPLKNTRLPFLADFDNIFNAFQGGLTTLNITGSIENPKYQQALVSDIGKTLRELLVGEAEGTGNAE